jgi:hypothetical protein
VNKLDGLSTGADSVGVESNWGQFASNSSIASALTGERALPEVALVDGDCRHAHRIQLANGITDSIGAL